MSGNKWSEDKEIKKTLKQEGAGAVVYCKNGTTYNYDGEGHVIILGVSGSGKSRRETIPMTMSFIKNRESAVIVDPKGEIYANTKEMISADYDVHVINFRSLYEPKAEGWNPLYSPYILWKKGTPESRHDSEQMIEDLSHVMYRIIKGTDPFWGNSGRSVFLGAVYSLFELAPSDQINLVSAYYLISKGDEKFGPSTYIKTLVDMNEKNENISMQLQSYVTTAAETRGGIRSTFLDGLSVATKSESVRSFLSHDEIHIHELTGEKPTLIYIILPDETPIYDDLAGVLVSQLMNHYVRMAERKYNGKLPIRLNILLEELGNIGQAITNLPHLMSAGRSRNIRVAFVLQSVSQLVDIYGVSNATTILGNCNVRIAFRVNNLDTLTELSKMCGDKEVTCEGHIAHEPLITPYQLSAMETGQALVMISGRTKFITWLPDFREMSISRYKPNQKYKPRIIVPESHSYFDIKKYVNDKKDEQIQKQLENMSLGIRKPREIIPAFMEDSSPKTVIDTNKNTNKRNVIIIPIGDHLATVKAIKNICNLSDAQVDRLLKSASSGRIRLTNLERLKAEMLVDQLERQGTLAFIEND